MRHSMTLLIIMLLKSSGMKVNWKQVAFYVLRIIELLVTGAAGGAIGGYIGE